MKILNQQERIAIANKEHDKAINDGKACAHDSDIRYAELEAQAALTRSETLKEVKDWLGQHTDEVLPDTKRKDGEYKITIDGWEIDSLKSGAAPWDGKEKNNERD